MSQAQRPEPRRRPATREQGRPWYRERVSPGLFAVVAMTMTSAVAWVLFGVFYKQIPDGELFLFPLLFLPFLWRGVALGLGVVLGDIALVLTLHWLRDGDVFAGLVSITMMPIVVGFGFSGQRGRARTFYPVSLATLGGALAVGAIAIAYEGLSLSTNAVSLAGVASTAFWCCAGLGDWLASSAWVQGSTASPDIKAPKAPKAPNAAPRRLPGVGAWLLDAIRGFQQPPGWRAVVATALLAALSSPLLMAVAFVGKSVGTAWDWVFALVGSPLVCLSLCLPVVVRGARPWLYASGVASIVFLGLFVFDKAGGTVSDLIFFIALIVGMPLAMLVGLRQGATPWRRVIAGVAGTFVGMLIVILVMGIIARVAPFNRSAYELMMFRLTPAVVLGWMPLALADIWITRPTAAPSASEPLVLPPLDDAPRMLVPATLLGRAAIAIIGLAIVLPYVTVPVLTEQHRSIVSEARGTARPEMLIRESSSQAAVSTTYVTRGQFELVMGYRSSTEAESPDSPVTSITRREAHIYCNALSRLESREECYSTSLLLLESACKGYRVDSMADWLGDETVLRGGFRIVRSSPLLDPASTPDPAASAH